MAVSREWTNLKSFLRKTYNKEVNEWFRDEPDPVPDNSTSRKQAKKSCLIRAKDSQNMALLKTMTFRYVVQRTHLKPAIFGTPIGNSDPIRKYKPFIGFYFREDDNDVEPDYPTLEGTIKYRLMNETSETITKNELLVIANKVKTEFGIGNGYVWKKGKDLASYTDKNNGYQFQLLVRNKTDAKELITKVLDTHSKQPNWKYLSYKEAENPTETYPTIPENHIILGKTKRKPRKRPIASVRFQYAYCSIWGQPEPIILYDRSFTHLNALVG